ncbi:Cna B-type domain-containing protein [Bhargavaea ullalensis]|uniref:LPXTG-motif cell wall-anchored protein n=1 Tax=Bhargavaea ullalensis TaxID=1265685 RepID=A0ABV2GEI5_9BACL
MPKLRGLSALFCALLILQLAVPIFAGASPGGGTADNSGRTIITKLSQTPETITWRVTINAAGAGHEGLSAAITFGPGLAHGSVSGGEGVEIAKTPAGWDVQIPPGDTPVKLDATAAVTDPDQNRLTLQATATFPDGVFKASTETAALKPAVEEEVPPAVEPEGDAPAESTPEEPAVSPEEPVVSDEAATKPSEQTTPEKPADPPAGQLPEMQGESPVGQTPEKPGESGPKPDVPTAGPAKPEAELPAPDHPLKDPVPPEKEPAPAIPKPERPLADPIPPEKESAPAILEPEPPLADPIPPENQISPGELIPPGDPDVSEKSDRPTADEELTVIEEPPEASQSPAPELLATGEYMPEPGGMIVPTELDGVSTNTHTRPLLLWVKDGIVHAAVKSTHALEYMELKGVRNTGADVYPARATIKVEYKVYDPQEGLKGNTGDAHWTVFKFNASALSFEDGVDIPFFIKGIGGGHDVRGGLVLTIPQKDITGNKVWVGGTERPAIELQLKAQAAGEPMRTLGTATVTGPAWSHTWMKVPRYSPVGKLYVFSVDEKTVPPNYTKTTDKLTVTNTYAPEQRTIRVEKRWIGPATDSVTIQLLADAKNTGKTLVLNASNEWTGSFQVNQFDDKTGNPINYTIKEVAVPGYSTTIAGTMDTGFIVTNANTATTEVHVAKQWVGPVAGPVTVALLANGQPTGKTVTLNETGNWKGVFNGLPIHDPVTGQPVAYSIVETQIPAGYEATYFTEENGELIVTNTAQTASITVLKVDETDKPLAGAVFELRDREGDVVGTLTTGEDGTIVFNDLPLGDYTLTETKAPAGYRLSAEPIEITLNVDTRNVFQKVVNSKLGWVLPDTGGLGTGLFYGGGALLMAAGLLLFRKREN